MFRTPSLPSMIARLARPLTVVVGVASVAAVATIGSPVDAQSAGDVGFASPGSLDPIVVADRDDPFVIRLPEAAACVGDTASGGWVWQTYMVSESINPTTIDFGLEGPQPNSTGTVVALPLFEPSTTPVVNKATAAATTPDGPGLVVGVPSFSFALLSAVPVSEIPEGVYNVGVACTRRPPGEAQQFDKFWNGRIEITHVGDSFTWAPQVAASVPDAPSIASIEAGDRELVVSFTAAPSGSPADSFTVSATDGIDTVTATGASSPITVTGLTNDVEYTVTVTASNASGSSPASTGSPGTPSAGDPGGGQVPGAPVSVAASEGDGRTEVTFAAGAGAAATSFEVSVTDGTDVFNGIGSASPITVIGLTNGVEYTVTVVAINESGRSPASAAVTVTPVAATVAPGAPTIDSITPGDGTLTVAFTADEAGGSATEFTVSALEVDATAGEAVTETGPTSPITLTGLTNGVEYTVTVVARNAVGASAESAALTATVGAQDSGGSTTGGTTDGGTTTGGTTTGGATTGGATTGGTTTGGTTTGGTTTGGTTAGGTSTGGTTGATGTGGTTNRTLVATGPSGTTVIAIWAVLLLVVGRVVILSGRKTKIISDQP